MNTKRIFLNQTKTKLINVLQDVKSYGRGTSLPPSALPRPPRSLKPPRKIDYDRLSDSELKARSQTPTKLSQTPQFDLKGNTIKRNDYSRRDYVSPAKNYVEMKEMLNFPNPHFSLKRKDYGSMNTKAEFSKPEHTSTKYYQRLEESPKSTKASDGAGGFKRSLLPSARKYSPAAATASNQNPNQNQNQNPNKQQHSRDSLNSSESNHSANSHLHVTSRTPPKYLSLTPQDKTASLPPKPIDSRMGRRGSSVTRGENRYKIQF